MQVKLVVVGGKTNRQAIQLKVPAVLGRSKQADLAIRHPTISRRHCQLYVHQGVLHVRDLGSLNGVYVDNRRVTDAVLPPNSQFTIGPVTFRVEYEMQLLAEQPASAAPGQMGQDQLQRAADIIENISEAAELPAIDFGIPAGTSEAPNKAQELPSLFADLEPQEALPEQPASNEPPDLPSLFPEELPQEAGEAEPASSSEASAQPAGESQSEQNDEESEQQKRQDNFDDFLESLD